MYTVDLAGLLSATLSLDARGRVVRASIPLQNLEIVRAGVFPTAGDTTRVSRRMARLRPIDPVPRGLLGEEVTFLSGETTLAGTLLRPDGRPRARYPAVVLLSGSGPQDRNGDTPGTGGVQLGLLRVLAERLGRSGVTTLRVDDRGVGASTGVFSRTTIADYLADARAAAALLRARPDVDPARVGVIGHSEGAMIACLLAAEDSALAAIGMLAGFAQPFAEIVVQQTVTQLRRAGLPEEHVRRAAAHESSFMDVLRARRPWNAEDVPESLRPIADRKRWLEDMVALDPSRIVPRVRCAVGIFHGLRDEQIEPQNAAALDSLLASGGNARRTTKTFARLDHHFTVPVRGGYADYTDPRARVDASFARAVARWAARALRPGA
jgi:hypothetical protein